MKYLISILISLSLLSCGLLSESNSPIEYNSQSFNNFKLSAAPDYELLKSWAVHPENKLELLLDFEDENSKLPVDVFFIYPTMLTDKQDVSWNADIYDTKTRDYVLESSVKYQSSAWYSVGNLYVPFYRQAHLRVFRESFWKNGGEQAYEMAYQDIRQAFITYLKKYNNSKPIIIAGHSQGAGHAKRLLKEFFDGKPLQKKLIAAYLIGTKITDEDFNYISHMTSEKQTGGFVTWNTYRLMSSSKEKKAKYTVSKDWIKGAISSNPITWDEKKTTNYSDHKGFLYLNKKVFPKSVKIENIDDKVMVKLPKMGIVKRFLLSTVKDYHKADINLFWEDIRFNSIVRSKEYLSNNN